MPRLYNVSSHPRKHSADGRDAELGEAFALVRSEMALGRRITALTHRLSDANLAAMPEFHQRVNVLRELQCVVSASLLFRAGSGCILCGCH